MSDDLRTVAENTVSLLEYLTRKVNLSAKNHTLCLRVLYQAREALAAAQPQQATVGDSHFEAWFAQKDMAHLGTKQLARDAYAAGMAEAAQPQQAAQPVAWRYEDARGHFRYRGYVPNFDVEYATLKPIPLFAAPQPQQKPGSPQ